VAGGSTVVEAAEPAVGAVEPGAGAVESEVEPEATGPGEVAETGGKRVVVAPAGSASPLARAAGAADVAVVADTRVGTVGVGPGDVGSGLPGAPDGPTRGVAGAASGPGPGVVAGGRGVVVSGSGGVGTGRAVACRPDSVLGPVVAGALGPVVAGTEPVDGDGAAAGSAVGAAGPGAGAAGGEACVGDALSGVVADVSCEGSAGGSAGRSGSEVLIACSS